MKSKVKLRSCRMCLGAVLLGICVSFPSLLHAVSPDLSSPEVRMGLENYYAKTGSEDLLSREQVNALVNRLNTQLQCIDQKLPAEHRMPQEHAKMRRDIDSFKRSPYSANLAFNFYAAHMLSQGLAVAALPQAPALAQCLQKEPLLPQLNRHIDLLSYAADIALASENYPGGRSAFFKSVRAPKQGP
jgi:HPt (histidine-containing phosphotransfer) domain-containing protein